MGHHGSKLTTPPHPYESMLFPTTNSGSRHVRLYRACLKCPQYHYDFVFKITHDNNPVQTQYTLCKKTSQGGLGHVSDMMLNSKYKPGKRTYRFKGWLGGLRLKLTFFFNHDGTVLILWTRDTYLSVQYHAARLDS